MHCCEQMTSQVNSTCTDHNDQFDCPDHLIHYTPEFDEYGIIIHDGGTSTITIEHCPWCGSKLPESKRDQWHETLWNMGFDSPWEGIPEEFLTDNWYRQ